MRHKDTIALYRYWDEIRKGREAPSRAEVAPAALGRLLPSVMLLQTKSGGDMTFRLAGTRLCSIRCRELRGEAFSGLFQKSDRATVERTVRSVTNGNTPVVLDMLATPRSGSELAMEALLLPLADETTRVIGIVSTPRLPDWFGLVPAELRLRGIRYMNPETTHPFLQNRPAVALVDRPADTADRGSPPLRVLPGSGRPGPGRALRAFRVLDGGKK